MYMNVCVCTTHGWAYILLVSVCVCAHVCMHVCVAQLGSAVYTHRPLHIFVICKSH